MTGRTWACFDCRLAVRRPGFSHPGIHPGDALCSRCGRPLRNLGYKIRIPPKDDEKAWKKLRKSIEEQSRCMKERKTRERVKRRHSLERQIVELECRPPSQGRAKAIRLLLDEIQGLQAH